MSNSRVSTWSGIRNKLENDYLCPALRGHIQYFATSYSKSADHEGRAAIRVDGVEVLRSNYYTYFENVWTKFHHLRSTTLKDHDSAKEAINQAHAYALEQGTFDQKVFYEAFGIFDNQSIEKSLVSENPLVRIFALLEEKEESADPTGTIDQVTGNVTIDEVAFSYDKDKKLIENFNLDVQPGMRVAIVGPTGCGKTTFINLLMRFYDVDAGKICIDGKPIDGLSRHALRSCFGMVLQDTWIKQGTVRDNISFGKPDATEEEIIRAAKEAHSWEFIKRLPKGLDTVLSEDSISQGQKQLLCITRVMLCLPPMLILDEATSSIDTRTELQVQEAFDKLMQGRTSFVVAHRLSTIRNASLILVMKDGKIIEQGRHEELLEKKGFYYNLYNSQFQAS